MQANITPTPLLNFGQDINTTTIGSNIGLNPIFGIIDSNLQQFRTLTNPSLAGGGIRDENIAQASITNVSTNLTMDTINQVGSVNTNSGSVENATAIVNGITTLKPNQKILFIFGAKVKPVNNQFINGSPESRMQAVLSVSTTSVFTSVLASATGTSEGHFQTVNNGVVAGGASNFFLGKNPNRGVVITFPSAGNYFVRLQGGHSGNYVNQTEISEGYISYIMN